MNARAHYEAMAAEAAAQTQRVDVLAARKPYQGAQLHLMGSSRHKPACGQRNARAVGTMESFLACKPEDRCEKCAALAVGASHG